MRPSTRLSRSDVVAFLALFVALGGSGYAAAKVTGRDIVNGSITSQDIKNGAIRQADLARSLRPAPGDPGPRGDAGSPGPAGPAGGPGLPGPAGGTGERGPAGERGTAGEQGPAGQAGPAGAEGERGPAGADGGRGPAGAPGAPGTDGAPGAPGADAPPVVHDEVLAAESTSSTTVTDLATEGPSVTIDVPASGLVEIYASARAEVTDDTPEDTTHTRGVVELTGGFEGSGLRVTIFGFGVAGQFTLRTTAPGMNSGNATSTPGGWLVVRMDPGRRTIKMVYRVLFDGSATFDRRQLFARPVR